MKLINRVLAIIAVSLFALTTLATAQTNQGVVSVAASLGSGTSASVYFNTDVTLDGKLDYFASMFHPQWCLLKDCTLDPEAAVFVPSPSLFAAAGTGKVSGNTLAGKKRDAAASVSVFVTDSGGRYKRGTTWFLIKDDLGIAVWIDLTYNNVFCKITQPTPAPPSD